VVKNDSTCYSAKMPKHDSSPPKGQGHVARKAQQMCNRVAKTRTCQVVSFDIEYAT